ncbi:hypothetical protein J4Q44_G00265800 [Coregonus suidteri]|uniref:ZZ-type zinc finger-containing protein 3 n=1 Tax=Coregonus suidteri TaxID=861788 RepID=A0AAN8QF35_9TELE
MATSRSSRVTRSSVGLNGLDENFCGRTLRNRSIAQPEEGQGSPLAGSRAPRSPKKRQDGQTGASEKPGAHQGKVAHHKATSVDGETWASPRKRVLSCSEREGVGGSEKAENCEGRRKETSGAGGRDASPILKRAKRCSRSGESHGSKDDPPSAPPKPDSPASPCAPSATVKENSEGGDLLRQNSTAASPCAPSETVKEEGEEEEEEEDDVGGHIESDSHAQQPQNSNSHKSRTGLGQTSSSPDAQTNSLGPSAATSTTCPGPGPALLNGSQRGAPPDPIVPSRNSDPGQEEEGKDSGEYPAPLLASFEEDSSTPHLSVREEEVDVVGDSVCREEEVTATEEVVVTATEEEEVTATGEEEVAAAATEEEVVVAATEEEVVVVVVTATEEEEVVVTATEEVVVTATEEEEVTATEEEEVTATEEVVVTATEEVVVTATEEVVVTATEEVVVAATEEETPHEHRYTLRTSPRRAGCGGGKAVAPSSSPKPCSPPRDNGPLWEGLEAGRELDATPATPNPSSGSRIQAREGSPLSVPMEQGNARNFAPLFPQSPTNTGDTLRRLRPVGRACGGARLCAPSSSPKPCSPPRDNGPLLEGLEAGRETGGLLPATPIPSSRLQNPGQGGVSPWSVPQWSRGNGGASGGHVGAILRGKGSSKQEGGARRRRKSTGGGKRKPDVYYFESDHLDPQTLTKITRGYSRGYQRVVTPDCRGVPLHQAQRTQGILDLERLARHQREALQDPVSFVEQLQKQVELDLPRPQRVVQLPDISWDQYTSGLGDFEGEFCDKKRKTRRLKLIFDKVRLPVRPKSPLDPKKEEEGEPSTLYSALPSSDAPENSSNSQMIRGRLCHQSKPDTFNQLWTVEEQKKLEHLLLKFSPEEVESKRWQKIADALGNRTAKQVASRVQKYFIKLTKAGIPVPGRIPNMCSKKVSNKRQHHLNKHLYRPSTFLTSYEPPVYMDEEDERAAYYSSLQDPDGDHSDEDGVPVELRHLPEYKELLELKRMKKHKLQEIQAESGMALHHGYKCDVCGVEPIQGVRWHCQDCPSYNAVDFCSNCSDCLYKTESHAPGHRLEPVYHHETFLDRDYCLDQTPGYNYLDPNYYPANR